MDSGKSFIINKINEVNSLFIEEKFEIEVVDSLIENFKSELMNTLKGFNQYNNLSINSNKICSDIDRIFINFIKLLKNDLKKQGYNNNDILKIIRSLFNYLKINRDHYNNNYLIKYPKEKIQVPRNTNDRFDIELQKIEFIKTKISKILRLYGYERVQTPVIEHTEIFKLTSYFDDEKNFNFLDKNQREIVLRPDINAPISRLIINNTKILGPLPYKLFFSDKVFRYRHSNREFELFGIEIYGEKGYSAEAEILNIVKEIVNEFGINDYFIEFNDLDILKIVLAELLKKYQVNFNIHTILFDLRNLNNINDINNYFELYGFSKEDINIIYNLVNCGNDNHKSIDYFDYLISIFPNLSEIKLKHNDFRKDLARYGITNVKFCLGKLHGTGFYSGLTYQFFIDEGLELADGGRYDNMIKNLGGQDLPGTGIGFGLERLIRLIEKNNGNIDIENTKSKTLVSLNNLNDIDLSIIMKLINDVRIDNEMLINNINFKDIKKGFKFVESKGYGYFFDIGKLNNKYFILYYDVKNNFKNKFEFDSIDDVINYFISVII